MTQYRIKEEVGEGGSVFYPQHKNSFIWWNFCAGWDTYVQFVDKQQAEFYIKRQKLFDVKAVIIHDA